MTTTHRKLLVGSLVFGLAIALMGWSIWREGWVYYMSVDEFVASDFAERDVQRVRLMGVAGANDFEVSHGGLWARFDLNGGSRSLRVEYHGIIPDMFNPGHEVIVEGRMNGSGIFEADTLMTKCGSRYESDEDKQRMPHADPRKPQGQVSGVSDQVSGKEAPS